jgi:hypothetical protein
MCTKGKYRQISPVEEDPTQIKLYVEPMAPFSFPIPEVRSESLSIIVSGGSKNNSKSCQSSGNITLSQNQLVVS